MNSKRANEIISSMKSFSKDSYERSELLDEMFLLQKEMVELTFSEEHADRAALKIWDIESHIEHLNNECGHIADDLLLKFKTESKSFCDMIKAEVSGFRGENKAFKALEHLKVENKILKNVELKDGNQKTELDAIVITTKSITIVEVKNTSKNIFIDESGNYYRVGEYTKYDSQIANKLQVKASLLKSILAKAGFGDVKINLVVVFTNDRIEVHNKCSSFNVCFLSQLNSIIESEIGEDRLPSLSFVELVIGEASNKESYPVKFDIAQYKRDFANLLAILEESNHKDEDYKDTDLPQHTLTYGTSSSTPNPIKHKRLKYSSIAAASAVLIGLGIAIIKKGIA